MKKIIKLLFDSPVHFGQRRVSDSMMSISADTLFSALFIEAIEMNMKTDWLLEHIKISDTFPFQGEMYYLPKPLLQINSKVESNDYKQFKKLKYIPINNYRQYLDGELNDEEAKKINESINIGKSSLTTKVNLTTSTENNELYSVGTYIFNEDAGLYFILDIDNEFTEQFDELMYSMEISGLGGKRSSGYGQFIYKECNNDEVESFFKSKGQRNILLSTAMINDYEKDLIQDSDRFILKKRSGFIQSTTFAGQLVKKKDFYSFDSGSVFHHKFEGDIFNVSKGGKHPVYRYAKAMWLEV